MSIKPETSFQRRLQVILRRRGAYVPKKNHGNMITAVGLQDLPITYRGLSLYWEAKDPNDPSPVSAAQGIHCRLARKAGGITAIISNTDQAEAILDHIDYCMTQEYSVADILKEMDAFYRARGLDDGSKY